MHESVMEFGRAYLHKSDVTGKCVLEVGAQNINGSLRGHAEMLGPMSYVGVDFAAGAGVDVVCDASDLVARFGASSFDVVLSTEMLEHAQDWRAAVNAMKAVLAPGGVILVTARGPGMFLHGYPFDYHRFTWHDASAIFADFQILELEADPQAPGFLLFARKPYGWKIADTIDLAKIEVAAADEVNAPR